MVTIHPGPLATITVTPNSVTVPALGTRQFTAAGADSHGNAVAISPTWSVTNGGGSINASGLFTAGPTPGTYANTVRASASGVHGSATVEVTVGPVATITIEPSSVTLPINATRQFTASGRDAAGNTVAITPTWSVIHGGGSIDASGLFTAGTTAGTFNSTVQASTGSVSATASVVVTPGPLATIAIAPENPTLAPGAQQQFTATGADSGGHPVSFTPTWSVVNGGGAITSAGLFTASTVAGTYADTIRVSDSATGISAQTSVTVNAGPLVAIEVTPQTAQTPVLGTLAYSATPKDAWGNRVLAPIAWSVEAGGTIDQSGVFTAGTVAGAFPNAIRASSGSVVGQASVQVLPGPVAAVAVAPQAADVAVNAQQAFTAQASDAFGNLVQASATWAVVAGGGSITPGGLFTAGTAAGTYPNTVRATMDGVEGFATVNVLPGALSQLTVAPASTTLRARATQQFTATGSDAYGNAVLVSPTWSVALPNAGTISPTGLFHAGAIAGNYPAAVVASVGQVTGFADVVVTAGPLASIVVTPASVELVPGDSQQFAAAGFDADGNAVPINPTWSLTAPAPGTIDASGRFVAGYALGAYPNLVRASADAVVGSASVTILVPPIDRVTIAPENPLVASGSQTTFTAAAFDAHGQEIAGLQVTWQLVNGGGSLSATGLFTAGGEPGVFADTVRATIAGKSASTTVSVSSDFDEDQMADTWEIAHGLNHTDAADAQGDPDEDGYPNLAEYQTGTDPNDADSDDDGVLDGNEVKPAEDSDDDGLVNALDPDSDNDGLYDGLEMAVTTAHEDTDRSKGYFLPDEDPSTSTDPTSADTDGDGLADSVEDINFNGKMDEGETDPNVPDKTCKSDAECDGGKCVTGLCKPADPVKPPCDPGCGESEYCNEETGKCEPVTASQTGCGCNSGAGALPFAGLAAVALLGLRRRRR
ncbi:MAG: MYXO-CTERM sorting domain-containing protein [Myxococcales bacterium]